MELGQGMALCICRELVVALFESGRHGILEPLSSSIEYAEEESNELCSVNCSVLGYRE